MSKSAPWASGTFPNAAGEQEVLFGIAAVPTMGKLGLLVLALGLGGLAARVIKRSRAAASLLASG